jgi:hypothetical protein
MTNTPGAISLIALGSTIGAGGTALGEVSLIDAASIVVRFAPQWRQPQLDISSLKRQADSRKERP